jgi:deoxyhypusine synthase
MERELYDRGMNRVTDTAIPEDVMRELEHRMIERWSRACAEGVRKTEPEFMSELLLSGDLEPAYQADPEDSWLMAAARAGIPVFAPGWEDSTLGNMFAAAVMRGDVAHHQCVKSGTEQFQALMEWYQAHHGGGQRPSVGFFQIGGGIAGDFAICTVPALIQDLQLDDTPFWGYFCQISDAPASYGGYSGAPPNEKITWGKLDVATPKFVIESDASIVAPLIFAYLLGD